MLTKFRFVDENVQFDFTVWRASQVVPRDIRGAHVSTDSPLASHHRAEGILASYSRALRTPFAPIALVTSPNRKLKHLAKQCRCCRPVQYDTRRSQALSVNLATCCSSLKVICAASYKNSPVRYFQGRVPRRRTETWMSLTAVRTARTVATTTKMTTSISWNTLKKMTRRKRTSMTRKTATPRTPCIS